VPQCRSAAVMIRATATLRRSVRTFSAWPLAAPRTVSLIGAPQQFGQPRGGVENAPKLLRQAGLAETVANLDWRVNDEGDVDMQTTQDVAGPLRHAAQIGHGSRKLMEACVNAHARGNFVLTLGGDHSVALGTVSAALKARPSTKVLWVDAHADCNSPATSPSGNAHGMPLAFLLKLVQSSELGAASQAFAWLDDVRLAPQNLAFVGLRDVDAEERKILLRLRERGAFVSTMHDVDRRGIGHVVDTALDHLGDDGPLHCSFDVDSCDPLIAPATGTAVRGGLTYREAHFLCEALAATGRLGSLDVVEVNSALADPVGAKATVDLAAGLVASALGAVIL
jgi:arginase